jgi:hypothetical protein
MYHETKMCGPNILSLCWNRETALIKKTWFKFNKVTVSSENDINVWWHMPYSTQMPTLSANVNLEIKKP